MHCYGEIVISQISRALLLILALVDGPHGNEACYARHCMPVCACIYYSLVPSSGPNPCARTGNETSVCMATRINLDSEKVRGHSKAFNPPLPPPPLPS